MDSFKNKEDFNTYARDKVYFYIESGFWSKPKMKDLQRWLGNFKSTQEKYCALKLLDRFVYYSEEDIIRLINFGIYEKIFKRYALKLEKESGFCLTNDDFLIEKKNFLNNAYFVPLQTGNLSQSSLVMARYLTIDIGISENKVLDTNCLNSDILNNCNNLIILDDFVGSGKQINDFWNFTKANLDGKDILFNRLKEIFPNMEVEYFCLVCTQEGYENFKYDHEIDKRNDLMVTYGELLGSRFKIFGENSVYFDSEEIERCKNIIEGICYQNKIDFLGYEGLDYAIAFHHGIPDCSLPLFYTNNKSWKYLFRNKKTDADV